MKNKKYINQFVNDILNKIESNKTKLIESFIIYYGEEYRQIITERFNKIDFGWYINDNTIKNLDLIIQDKNDHTSEKSQNSITRLSTAIQTKKYNINQEILGTTNTKYYTKEKLYKIPKNAYSRSAFKVTLSPSNFNMF